MDLKQNIDGGVSPDSLPQINNLPAAPVAQGAPFTQTQAGAGQPPIVVPIPSGGQYAEFGTRFLAFAIDTSLFLVVGFAVGWGSFFVSMTFVGGQNFVLAMILQVIQFIIQILVAVYYFGIYQHKTGQTVGKKVLGIKVVDMVSGQTPSVGKLLQRDIVGKLISGLVIIGYYMPLWDPKKQALHDKIAGTVVVKV